MMRDILLRLQLMLKRANFTTLHWIDFIWTTFLVIAIIGCILSIQGCAVKGGGIKVKTETPRTMREDAATSGAYQLQERFYPAHDTASVDTTEVILEQSENPKELTDFKLSWDESGRPVVTTTLGSAFESYWAFLKKGWPILVGLTGLIALFAGWPIVGSALIAGAIVALFNPMLGAAITTLGGGMALVWRLQTS